MRGTIRTCIAFKFSSPSSLIDRTIQASISLCDALTRLLTLDGASLRRSSIMSASENPHVARKETALLAALSVIENSLALLDNPRPIYSPHASSKIELARYRRWYKILEFRIRRQILMAGVGPHVVIASAIGDRSRQGTLRRGVGVKKPWGGYDADQLGRWIVEVEDVCSKMRDEFDELTAGGKDG